ncbi:hypothetical protein [Microbacterium sp.]|uniref:hypothetical protein n=1 Tax=Microbacterium sp. TaxID=51671 RepID=UPI0028111547|nr:hypothetical protein [Microbacterium sp.]
MQIITYAGDEYLTGDAIASALLAYSRALGEEDRAEVVEIPIRDEDGSVVTAKFLIGPASQIVAKSVTGHGPELEDPELVQRLQQLTRGVESPAGGALEASDEMNRQFD